MAIFSETDVQSAFDSVALLLSDGGAKQILRRLRSRRAKDALSAEWEIVLLNALRSCGTVEVEPLLQSGTGESRPDVLLRPSTNDRVALFPPCYIEISAVSDDGYEDENPRYLFIEAFKRELKRRRLPVERFRLDIQGAVQDKTDRNRRASELSDNTIRKPAINWDEWFRGSTCNDRKMRLALPAKSDIEPLVRGRIAKALRAISREGSRPHSVSINDNGVRIDIHYHPQRTVFSYGFPSYTTAHSLAYNPVARRLNAKVDQISKGAAPRGVILCDRGCDILLNRGYPGPDGFGLQDIVRNVLARRDEISFVVTCAVQQKLNGWGRYDGLQLSVEAFHNPQKAAIPVGKTELAALVRKLSNHLPLPIATPKNAAHAIGRLQPVANYHV